jgi:hypothetical protein
MPAFSLLSQARAAEDALFAGDKVLHFVNEIIVKAVSNPVLAQMRWVPMVSVEATGKPRFHQLTLPAKPGESFTVADQAWYDPPTIRSRPDGLWKADIRKRLRWKGCLLP